MHEQPGVGSWQSDANRYASEPLLANQWKLFSCVHQHDTLRTVLTVSQVQPMAAYAVDP